MPNAKSATSGSPARVPRSSPASTRVSIADILDTVPGEGLDRMTPQSDSAYNTMARDHRPVPVDHTPDVKLKSDMAHFAEVRSRGRTIVGASLHAGSVPREPRTDLFIDTQTGFQHYDPARQLPLLSTGRKLRSMEECSGTSIGAMSQKDLELLWLSGASIVSGSSLIRPLGRPRLGPELWKIRSARARSS